MMKQLLGLVAASSVFLASPIYAQSNGDMTRTLPEGARLANLTFDAVDRDGNDFADRVEMERQRADIFISQDADESGKVELEEFLAWDFGFSNEADAADRRLAYDTALKVVFSFWDTSGNGALTEVEHRDAMKADIQRADRNRNGVLEREEFVQGYSVLVAIRAALKPED